MAQKASEMIEGLSEVNQFLTSRSVHVEQLVKLLFITSDLASSLMRSCIAFLLPIFGP